MEGHGGDLEKQSGQQRNHRHPDQGVAARPLSQGGLNVSQARRAGEPVEQRHAVEQQAGGERAEQEELHRRFVRAPVPAQEARQHVLAQRHQFERDEEHNQVRARGEKHHADGREQQQRVILAEMHLLDFQVLDGNQHHDGRGEDDDEFQENREGVEREPAIKSRVARGLALKHPHQELDCGKPQPKQRRHRIQELIPPLQHEINHQDAQTEQRQDDLRRDGQVIRPLKKLVPKVSHQCATPARLEAVWATRLPGAADAGSAAGWGFRRTLALA